MEIAAPLHLCQNRDSASYPVSRERNKPINAVSAAVNAATSISQAVTLTISLRLSLRFKKKITSRLQATTSAMGKCRTIGCILPATCNQAGRTTRCSNKRRNTSRQLKAIARLKTMFLKRLIRIFAIWACQANGCGVNDNKACLGEVFTPPVQVCKDILYLSSIALRTGSLHRQCRRRAGIEKPCWFDTFP